MTMEQGAVLSHQFPISDYTVQSHQDFVDHFPGTGPSNSYPPQDALDRIHYGGVPNHHSANLAYANQFSLKRGGASERNNFSLSSNCTDCSSASLPTGRYSAESLVSNNANYSTCHYTSAPCFFPGSVPLTRPFTQILYESRTPSSTSLLPSSLSTAISNPAGSVEAEPFSNSTSYIARTQTAPSSQAKFVAHPNTPRTIWSTSLPLPSSSLVYQNPHMALPTGHGHSPNDCSNFPWPTLEVVAEITCNGQAITPEIHAKVEKGFFPSPQPDSKWTCYRRNYFSVQCQFELHPNIPNGPLYLKRNNKTEQIQAMGVCLSAAVDGANGKSIELVQHTPKRDNGPKNRIEVTKVSPLLPNPRTDNTTVSSQGLYQMSLSTSTFHTSGHPLGPSLPLQNADEMNLPSTRTPTSIPAQYPYTASMTSHLPLPSQTTSHTFERVQFKCATANNGKRRASQQYFHLIVGLYADVRKSVSGAPEWVKVAHRLSEKIVVRGRSPSHYQNEGQNYHGRAGHSVGAGAYSSSGGAMCGNSSAGAYHSGASAYSLGIGSSGPFRTQAYDLQPSPENLSSNGSSFDGPAGDPDYATDSLMDHISHDESSLHDGYESAQLLMDGHFNQGHMILPKIEPHPRLLNPGPWIPDNDIDVAMPDAQWLANGCPRIPGFESCRGYYSDLHKPFPP